MVSTDVIKTTKNGTSALEIMASGNTTPTEFHLPNRPSTMLMENTKINNLSDLRVEEVA